MSHPHPTGITTLQELQQQKAEALKELRIQQEKLTSASRNLFAPPAPATSKGASFMQLFNTGMAIFDGAMIGIKVIRSIQRIFGKRKK